MPLVARSHLVGKACRVHRFGPPEVITIEDLDELAPGEGEVLVRVKAAGVGPWDAWIRAGKSALPQPLPLTLGSDLSGIVEAVGEGVAGFAPGDAVFGVTNPRFTGSYADYAVASASMIARKPPALPDIEAASVPVVAVTAWQALFEHAQAAPGQTVLVLGAAGNVGSYAVQFAHQAGLRVIATATAGDDAASVSSLGADETIDLRVAPVEDSVQPVDVIIDLIGGDIQTRSLAVLKGGGALISAVSPPAQIAAARGVRAAFFLVEVTTERLAHIAAMISSGTLTTTIGTILPLGAARTAHEMLEGQHPRPRGKIVLRVAD